MVRFYRILFCLGFLLVAASFRSGAVHSQDFPYVVPQAPEFDGRGNQVDAQPGYPESPRKRSKHRPDSYSTNDQADFRSVRPYNPQESSVPAAAVRPSMPAHVPPPRYESPPAQGPPVASIPQQPPAAAQQRPDCSRYPIMIAQARSDQEMQIAARMFLTCLLQTGWNMDQAKAQVIRTIETTYRVAR
jgi:hypothetical protein